MTQINSMAFNINSILQNDSKLPASMSCSKLANLLTTDILILDDDYLLTDVQTTEHVPLFLLNGQINSKIRSSHGFIQTCKFPDLTNTATNTDNDAQYAKLCSSLAYATLRQIDKFIHNYKLACSIPAKMFKLINTNVKHLEKNQSSIFYHLNTVKERLKAVDDSNTALATTIKKLEQDKVVRFNSGLLQQLPEIDSIQHQYDKMYHAIKSLSPPRLMDDKMDQLKELWPLAKEVENTKRLIVTQSKAKIFTAKIRESWLLLHKDKQIKSLNFHEDQLHQLEK